MTDLPPAGWYADPEDPSQQRYWDGSAWTAHRTPATPQTSSWEQQQSQAPSWGTQPGASPYPGQGGGFPQPGPETSGAAIAALVMGILSIVACLGPITGIPAIVVGRRAAREIDASHGAIEGRGLASGGVVTGVIGTAIWALIAVFLVIGLVAFSSSTSP